jgi:hypothetical protein
VPPKVGPHRQHYRSLSRYSEQTIEKGGSLAFVAAEGEDLLELVNDQQ